MSETSENRSFTPYLIIAAVLLVGVLAVAFWPSPEAPPVEPEPVVALPEPEPEPEQEVFAPAPPPPVLELEATDTVDDLPEPMEIEPEPLDTSDIAVRNALMDISGSEQEEANRILVSDSLLQRFVVTTTNLADHEMAPNHQLLTPPQQSFRVYSQAGKQWIDAASYKRYTSYVNLLEGFDTDALLALYQTYKQDIQAKYDEIGDPGRDFDRVFVQAIDHLLDTPEVPVPVEVYTDSVMYKYADERLQNLDEPQKQLLRTGPDNMRRIKAKLRELKVQLLANGSN
ncbi:DUF3014 domain-containing protein [Alteromonas sp. KUL49]|uniref:DUF3014 domain-containing protein n=1 Tax=Alteromonas sp. KUL49 TaxID=2480798 RepID=UPI00102F02D1|nr:DUF3014 domain-containing protein [Alteromonas sp. KUL49]TAP42124.1 DUF3014 domain-containing protein [Alteromonas sp. KUL49]